MVHSLETSFDRLEKQLDHLLQMAQPLSREQQNFKPDNDSWSILQIFRHMMQSEGQIHKYLQKKILGAEKTQKAGIGAVLRSTLLNTAMRLPFFRYKVPDAIKVDFEESYDYETLAAEWKKSRKALRDFLENVDDATARKEIFRHPVAGLMSLLQGLAFMQEHLERHTRQAERIVRHVDFPK